MYFADKFFARIKQNNNNAIITILELTVDEIEKKKAVGIILCPGVGRQVVGRVFPEASKNDPWKIESPATSLRKFQIWRRHMSSARNFAICLGHNYK